NPNFSRIVSSAACLSSKPLVSSETFTCMYGFPATYLRQEQTADLKLVADALFAQGVNQHFYHGMPYQPKGADSIDFFATTYFGPGGSLTQELPAFNAYMEKVSGLMQRGKTYSDVAVYIPYEDGVMKGAYPPERQRVWVWGEYELRYIHPPEEIAGYHPLWINRHFLMQAEFKNGKLIVGDAAFSTLYIDVEYMDVRALRRILELAKKGLPVCLKKLPNQPGHIKTGSFDSILGELASLRIVSSDFNVVIDHPPLIQGDSLPGYWCRVEEDGSHLLFLAQPLSTYLTYPLYSGQSLMKQSVNRKLKFTIAGKTITLDVEFKPYQSVILKVAANGKVEQIDITFIPKEPVVRPRETQKMYF
ncbi:MAG TPA: glycosyl hydrolase, partial [Saprospiraceae bacterium]|nr:glycosyl hydrolase [Saprospiraceae bacterium]